MGWNDSELVTRMKISFSVSYYWKKYNNLFLFFVSPFDAVCLLDQIPEQMLR